MKHGSHGLPRYVVSCAPRSPFMLRRRCQSHQHLVHCSLLALGKGNGRGINLCVSLVVECGRPTMWVKHGKAMISHPFGNGLHNLFMVIYGTVCSCFNGHSCAYCAEDLMNVPWGLAWYIDISPLSTCFEDINGDDLDA